MAERPRATARPRPPLWRNPRARRLAGQALFLVAVVAVAREAFLNLEFGVAQQQQDLTFGFLRSRAGFGIKEGIAYSPNDSVLRAFVVGLVNTVLLSAIGIVLATFLGLVLGVARLSPNWLVRRIAALYVNVIRNTPVAIQIIFWWAAAFLALPAFADAVSIGEVAFVSNRGAAIPRPRVEAGAAAWGIVLLAGVAAAVVAWVWRTRLNERTGRPHRRVLWSLGVLTIVAVAGFLATGTPLRIEVPEPLRFSYRGGFQLSPEFAALLLALVIYTGAFIAEIVRGSIQAVDRGQKEAAEALGFTPFQQLRYIVLPQALRIAIPPVNSQYLNLMKNSSLGILIAYPELAAVTGTIINQKAHETQMLLLMMGTYLALSLTISAAMNGLNRAVATRGQRR
jgi:general L-amino acid transport system permease protein